MMCGPRNEEESEENGTESEMTEGIEETITDLEGVLAKRTRRVPRKTRVPRSRSPPAYIQLSLALHQS